MNMKQQIRSRETGHRRTFAHVLWILCLNVGKSIVGVESLSSQKIKDWKQSASSLQFGVATREVNRRETISSVLALLSLFPQKCRSAEIEQTFTWQLGNGEVSLPKVIAIANNLQLENPVLLGSGGGGAVFSTTINGNPNQRVALKISWKGSTKQIVNECQILQKLENNKQENQVANVEMCLGVYPYPGSTEGRVMIALQPVFNDEIVADFQQLSHSAKSKAVTSTIETMIQMLAANIVSTDIQPLISINGDVLFIDFSEANELPENGRELSFQDVALIGNFVNEMMALISVDFQESIASSCLMEQIQKYPLRPEIYEALLVQNFSKEALQLLESKLL